MNNFLPLSYLIQINITFNEGLSWKQWASFQSFISNCKKYLEISSLNKS